MGEVLPLPNRGEVFLDPRGEGRSLRVSWHRHESTLVLSLWQLGQCRATFRLPTDEVPNLVHALVSGLSDGLAEHRDARQQLSRLLGPPDGPLPPRWDRAAKPAEPPTVPLDAPAEPANSAPSEPGKATQPERKPRPAEVTGAHPQIGVPAVTFLAPPEPA